MKTLTICQPYAELIARGVKRVENRSWATGYRGSLAIHAGKSRARVARDGGGRTMNDSDGCFALIFSGAFLFLIGLWFGLLLGESKVKHDAVEHHAAEYRCDPKTGETSFVWLTDIEGE